MVVVKKVPQRLCVGCQSVRLKKELIRIVRSPEGEYSVDRTGKKPGRGTYICPNKECFELAAKGNRFSKAFKEKISIEIIEELRKQLADISEN